MRPKITHVAIRFHGVTYALPAPNRHHHIIGHIVRTTDHARVDAREDDQGFLDEAGSYLTRRQALISALENNQVKQPENVRHEMLFSEDVW